MNPNYVHVAVRASHRCEYCQAPEEVFNFPFEVEHIIPLGRGGANEDSNLALSCRACNLRKSDRLDATDPDSGRRVPLFHPRRQAWKDHFAFAEPGTILIGLSPTGRATIAALELNDPRHIAARKGWVRLKIFPPLD